MVIQKTLKHNFFIPFTNIFSVSGRGFSLLDKILVAIQIPEINQFTCMEIQLRLQSSVFPKSDHSLVD